MGWLFGFNRKAFYIIWSSRRKERSPKFGTTIYSKVLPFSGDPSYRQNKNKKVYSLIFKSSIFQIKSSNSALFVEAQSANISLALYFRNLPEDLSFLNIVKGEYQNTEQSFCQEYSCLLKLHTQGLKIQLFQDERFGHPQESIWSRHCTEWPFVFFPGYIFPRHQ